MKVKRRTSWGKLRQERIERDREDTRHSRADTKKARDTILLNSFAAQLMRMQGYGEELELDLKPFLTEAFNKQNYSPSLWSKARRLIRAQQRRRISKRGILPTS